MCSSAAASVSASAPRSWSVCQKLPVARSAYPQGPSLTFAAAQLVKAGQCACTSWLCRRPLWISAQATSGTSRASRPPTHLNASHAAAASTARYGSIRSTRRGTRAAQRQSLLLHKSHSETNHGPATEPHNAQLANLSPARRDDRCILFTSRSYRPGHPKITGSWMLGLALVVFATGFRVSDEASQYEQDVQAADLSNHKSGGGARGEPAVCSERIRRFSCDDRCQYQKRRKPPQGVGLSRAREVLDYQTPKGVCPQRVRRRGARDRGPRLPEASPRSAVRDLLFRLRFSGRRTSRRRRSS